MAGMYDAITNRSGLRPRYNKNFVSWDVVPEQVKSVLTADNIVDENGMVIVDNKNDTGRELTDENKTELAKEGQEAPAEITSAPEIDTPSTTETETAPMIVDDSANQNQTGVEENVDKVENIESAPAPVSEAVAIRPPAPVAEVKRTMDEAIVPKRATRATARVVTEKFRSKVPQSNPGMGFPRNNGKTSDIFDINTPHTHVKLVGGHAVPLSYDNFKNKTDNQIISKLRELGFEVVDFNQIDRNQVMSGSGMIMDDDIVEDDIMLG